MKKKRIFAIAVAILMLVVSVVHVMAHDHEGEIELLASTPCCSNPYREDFITHYRSPGGFCYGTTYNKCRNCGDYISGDYYNVGPCTSTCYLPSWKG